jgi:phosphoribosylaminoimidazole carboxylase PurE protein
MSASEQPVVGVVMGSDSDLETMRRCLERLKALGVAHELRVISAHRTPAAAQEYAATAGERGLKVIIAAAGMSAALAGVLAAHTTLPVIGVPIEAGPLKGIDALLSTVQMPPGVPVACVAVGAAGAANAAVLAAQILATADPAMRQALARLKAEQAEQVRQKDAAVRRSP